MVQKEKMNKNTQKNAIVTALHSDTDEILQLADTLGYHVCNVFIQRRDKPDVNSYIGPGKVKELQDFLENHPDIETLIVDGELYPSLCFTLEKKRRITVYDRIRLILAIFEKRADRKEAKLQVQLAQLQYERPYVRELIHRARAGEHPGFMAGGEYQVDDYYEKIKKQMKKIKGELEKIRDTRELHRRTRYRSGFYLLSLAGYTNAGKSSLLNLLAGENVKVGGKLFSTLSTTTRRIEQDFHTKKIPILLTDTVGFIQNLPAWIIDAFHSTLEEIEVADVILLLVDGGEPLELIRQKLMTSLGELQEIGADAPTLIVLNKIDRLTQHELISRMDYLQETGLTNKRRCVPISVKENININDLIEAIYQVLPHRITLQMQLPITKETQSFISSLYKTTRVVQITYNKDIHVTIECNVKLQEKLRAQCLHLNGTVQ
jgi:GTP-binding protein HflX